MKLKTKRTGVAITFINGKIVTVEDIVEHKLQESLFKRCRKDFKIKLYFIGVVLEAGLAIWAYPSPSGLICPLILCGCFLNSLFTRITQLKNK